MARKHDKIKENIRVEIIIGFRSFFRNKEKERIDRSLLTII